jgi:hypothetical protein
LRLYEIVGDPDSDTGVEYEQLQVEAKVLTAEN